MKKKFLHASSSESIYAVSSVLFDFRTVNNSEELKSEAILYIYQHRISQERNINNGTEKECLIERRRKNLVFHVSADNERAINGM